MMSQNTCDATDVPQSAAALMHDIVARDQEIALLEADVSRLPDLLAHLSNHPVLWLVRGRDGIDQPGGLGAVVGQQVVTVAHTTMPLLVLVGMLCLAIGGVLGAILLGGIGGGCAGGADVFWRMLGGV